MRTVSESATVLTNLCLISDKIYQMEGHRTFTPGLLSDRILPRFWLKPLGDQLRIMSINLAEPPEVMSRVKCRRKF